MALSLVVVAVTLVMGVVIYSTITQNIGNTLVVNESLGFSTTVGNPNPPRFFNTQNSPIYFGQTLATGEQNATMFVVNGSTITALTLTCCQFVGTPPVGSVGNNVFNITGLGRVAVNSTQNGTMLISYTVERVSAAGGGATTMSSINTAAMNGYNLAAISLIVIAAVAILAVIGFLGLRA